MTVAPEPGRTTTVGPLDSAGRGSTRRTGRRLVGFAIFGAVIFVLGQGAVLLAPEGFEVAAWWPAAGVSVAAVALFYGSRWRLAAAIVLFSALANLAGGRPASVAIGFGIANAAEALVAGWWLQRSRDDRPALHGLTDVWRLAVAAVLGGVTIGAGASLTVAWLLDGSITTTFVAVVPSHVAAVLLLVPLALSTSTPARRSQVEVTGSWLLAAGAPLAVFAPGQLLPVAFLALSPLMWAALRFGVRTVAAQLVVVGVTVTFLTGQGAGTRSIHQGWFSS